MRGGRSRPVSSTVLGVASPVAANRIRNSMAGGRASASFKCRCRSGPASDGHVRAVPVPDVSKAAVDARVA